MIVSNPQDTVKELRSFRVSGLTLLHISWSVFLVLSLAISAFMGLPSGTCFAIGGVGLLPLFAHLYTSGAPARGYAFFNEGAHTLGWTGFALIANWLAGAPFSPLSMTFFLGPAMALAAGRKGLVVEMMVFGLTVYLGLVVSWMFNALPSASNATFPIAVAAALQMGMALLTIHPRLTESAQSGAPVIKDTCHGLEDTPVDPLCLDHAPWTLVGVAAEGRIRAVKGNQDMWWPDLRPGKIFADAFPTAATALDTGQPVRTPGGQNVRLHHSQTKDGYDVYLVLPEASASNIDVALAERTAFFAGLGHDLKTPLNAILGFSDLMKAEVRGPLPEAYRDYAGLIHESGQDLILLVDDILDLAKADAKGHAFDLEPVDLGASAMSVMRQLDDQADRAGVTLKLNTIGEVWAQADARAIRQIWQNLISNAIKYSGRGERVLLACKIQDGMAMLSVSDEGAGMNAEDLARIAKPFAQGENAKGRLGTGLGLAVVKSFADAHGGKVVIETAPGQGTKVQVILPRADIESIGQFGEAAQ